MDKTFIKVLIIMFTAVLAFFAVNTIMGEMVPIFNQTATSFDFVNQSRYEARAANIQTMFWIAIFIIVAIPITYLFIRIFRKEPQPQEYYGGYYQ